MEPEEEIPVDPQEKAPDETGGRGLSDELVEGETKDVQNDPATKD
jgi:hypothetical protein